MRLPGLNEEDWCPSTKSITAREKLCRATKTMKYAKKKGVLACSRLDTGRVGRHSIANTLQFADWVQIPFASRAGETETVNPKKLRKESGINPSILAFGVQVYKHVQLNAITAIHRSPHHQPIYQV